MRLVYSRHVLDRMAQRQISEADVEHALLNAGVVRPGQKPGRFVYSGDDVGGRPIMVVATELDLTGETATIVITTARRDEED